MKNDLKKILEVPRKQFEAEEQYWLSLVKVYEDCNVKEATGLSLKDFIKRSIKSMMRNLAICDEATIRIHTDEKQLSFFEKILIEAIEAGENLP